MGKNITFESLSTPAAGVGRSPELGMHSLQCLALTENFTVCCSSIYHLCPCRGRGRPGDDLPDDCKLYVGNLSPVVNDSVLRQLFEPFGQVLHAVVLMDVVSNSSRGYGFVHMSNTTSAANAARGLNSKVPTSSMVSVQSFLSIGASTCVQCSNAHDTAKLYHSCEASRNTASYVCMVCAKSACWHLEGSFRTLDWCKKGLVSPLACSL